MAASCSVHPLAPASENCPRCDGIGYPDDEECWLCHGGGILEAYFAAVYVDARDDERRCVSEVRRI